MGMKPRPLGPISRDEAIRRLSELIGADPITNESIKMWRALRLQIASPEESLRDEELALHRRGIPNPDFVKWTRSRPTEGEMPPPLVLPSGRSRPSTYAMDSANAELLRLVPELIGHRAEFVLLERLCNLDRGHRVVLEDGSSYRAESAEIRIPTEKQWEKRHMALAQWKSAKNRAGDRMKRALALLNVQ